MQWLINGQSYSLDSYPIQTHANTVELWDIQNAQRSMPHPMHLHGFSFQVVSRHNSPNQVRQLAQDASGRLITDLGWKDTILVWPGETVRIAIDFTNTFKGDQIYLFHCHNLEHEDQGMMLNYRVIAA
jgi:blue copper oxidase